MSTETYRPIKVHIVIQTQRDDFFFKKRHVYEPHAKGSVQFFFYKDRQIFFRVPRTTNAFPRIGHRIPLHEPPRSSAHPTAHCGACDRPYPRFPSHVDAMLTPSHDSLAADTDAPYRARICHARCGVCAPAARGRDRARTGERQSGEQRETACPLTAASPSAWSASPLASSASPTSKNAPCSQETSIVWHHKIRDLRVSFFCL